MNANNGNYGSLLFFTKNGEPGTTYPLYTGKTCIGSSKDADIRLKVKDQHLEEVHCIIDVTDNGIATLVNKSAAAPVGVNEILIKTVKVLCNDDIIQIVGKRFKYLNDKLSQKDVEFYQAKLNRDIRQSMAPSMKIQSAKKSTNLQRKSSLKKSHMKTPENKTGRLRLSETSKTTSRITAYKPLVSPANAKSRRLSFESRPKGASNRSRVSSRNILLSQDIMSSTITEEQNVPSTSLKVGNLPTDFMDTSNVRLSTSDESFGGDSSKKMMSMTSPSKSCSKIIVTKPTPSKKSPNTVKTPKTLTPGTKLSWKKTPISSPVIKKPVSLKKVSSPVKSAKPSESIKKTPKRSVNLINFDDSVESVSDLVKSARKTPLKETKQKSVGSAKKSINLIDFDDVHTPQRSKANISAKLTVSAKKSVANGTPLGVLSSANHRMSKIDKSLSSTKVQSKNDTVLDVQSTPKNVPDQSSKRISIRKSKLSGVESEDAESVKLNLSSASSYSTIPRQSLSRTDSDITNDPRLTLGKASPRKSPRKNTILKGIDTSSESSVEKKELTVRNGELKQEIEADRSSVKYVANINELSSSEESEEPEKVTRYSRPSRLSQNRTLGKISGQLLDTDSSSSSGYAKENSVVSDELLQNESFSSSVSSLDEYIDLEETQNRRSSRKTNSKINNLESEVKPLFAPKCRPSIKRSYVLPESEKSESLTLEVQNTTFTRRSSRRNSAKYCKSCENSPVKTSVSQHEESFEEGSVSSESILSSIDGELRTYNSESTKIYQNENESVCEYSEMEIMNTSSKSKCSLSKLTIINNKTLDRPASRLRKNMSVISVADSVKNTPENNTSVIILDGSFQQLQENSHKKLSKTLNSSFEDSEELATPKSAIKSRRVKSAPYFPVVEDITPVTPEESARRSEGGFKTPLNTPGLFENIKNSVLKSRGRRRSSNNLMEELNKAEVTKGVKRMRESSGTTDRSAKKGKLLNDSQLESVDENFDESFASFETDEVFEDMSDSYVSQTTPHDFKNLTDKPVLNDPQSQNQTKRKSNRSTRISSQSIFDSQSTDQNNSVSTFDTNDTISNTGSSRSSRSSSRLSSKSYTEERVAKVQKSPKNDLTDVQGVKRLMSTPKLVKSPRNDLTVVAGVKKLLSTPKAVKSPKNDLTQVPNLRRIMSPRHQNSPKNDLSDVAGLKKLLSTPKKQKQPKNDLTNIVGVKKLLSTPKVQNQPKNDLTNVPNLRKIMSPKSQNSPRNDLTDVRGLKSLMNTPRQRKEPLNDLSDVEGVANIFAVPELETNTSGSDIENNADLFDDLFVKKPIRTYRGKSLSPLSRKSAIYSGQDRKTLGDVPISSPRIKQWLKDQAVIQLEKLDDEPLKTPVEEEEVEKRTPRGRKKKPGTSSVEVPEKNEKRTRGRSMKVVDGEKVETPKRSRRGQKKELTEEESIQNSTIEDDDKKKQRQTRNVRTRNAKPKEVDSTTKDEELKPKRATRRGRTVRDNLQEIEEEHGTTSETLSEKPAIKEEENDFTDTDELSIRNASKSASNSLPPRRALRVKRTDTSDVEQATHEEDKKEVLVPKRTRRGRKASVDDKDTVTVPVARVTTARRGAKMQEEEQKSDSIVEEPNKPLPKRGKKKLVTDEETQGDDMGIPTKKTRGYATRGKKTAPVPLEDDIENAEDAPATKTRGRRQPAKAKTHEPAEEKIEEEKPRSRRKEIVEVQDSPRETRQKRGNFKKYGSEFLTEPRLTSKTVHFEDSEDDDGAKKRKGNKTEDVEDATVRRSKRNRK